MQQSFTKVLIPKLWSLQISRNFHVSTADRSRIKRRFTHKPFWHVKKTNKVPNEPITLSNAEFLEKTKRAGFIDGGDYKDDEKKKNSVKSPLKAEFAPWPKGEWTEIGTTRCGLLARKIGVVPQWDKRGNKILCTMLHVEDNHVIKYISPEDYAESYVGEKIATPNAPSKTKKITHGVLVVGALGSDPSKYTKDYCGLFTNTGLLPKKKIVRFSVSKNALIQPGTPLYASHFQVGQYLDIVGTSIRRGFQGVMKRWGFHGMPKARGVTKSHRRPGHIGSGCDKSRVWPGQKLPGDMGGRKIKVIGIHILRINNAENVIYVKGHSIPGETGAFVQLFDSKISTRRLKAPPRFFPTSTTEEHESLPEEEFYEKIHQMTEPTISFKESISK